MYFKEMILLPIYRFVCDNCGTEFEKYFEKISDYQEESIVCPKCGGKVKKVLPSSIRVIYKSKGFYNTDIKKGDK